MKLTKTQRDAIKALYERREPEYTAEFIRKHLRHTVPLMGPLETLIMQFEQMIHEGHTYDPKVNSIINHPGEVIMQLTLTRPASLVEADRLSLTAQAQENLRAEITEAVQAEHARVLAAEAAERAEAEREALAAAAAAESASIAEQVANVFRV